VQRGACHTTLFLLPDVQRADRAGWVGVGGMVGMAVGHKAQHTRA
jgi:hypothetical protein